MAYVDGFLLAVPKDKLANYQKAIEVSKQRFEEWGATDYVECIADDVPYGELTSFPRAVMARDDEVVIFSWVTYPSKQVRDEVMAKMMKDESMMAAMEGTGIDGKRMIFGGFTPLIGL